MYTIHQGLSMKTNTVKVEKRLRALEGLAGSAPAGILNDIDIRQIRVERALKHANYG